MDESYITESDTIVDKNRVFLGMEFAPRYIPFSRRVETFAIIVYVSFFLFVGILGIPFLVYLLFYTDYYVYALMYIAWYLYDFNTSEKGGRRLQALARCPLWFSFRDYFPIRLIKTTELDPKANYVFGYHPHGIMAFGATCFGTEAMGFQRKFPGITPHVLVLRGWFKLPFVRDLFTCMGACSVSKESIQYILSEKGEGASVLLPVGGAAEVMNSHPGKVILKLKHRKGFIRRAIIAGAKLVPVFAFGENEVYRQVANPEGSILRDVQSNIKKVLGFYPALIYGRGVFQYTYGFLPHRKPIYVIVGKPIEVTRWINPGEEEVNATHARYLKELKEMFDKYKASYGMKDSEMVFS